MGRRTGYLLSGLLLFCAAGVSGYSTGAATSACNDQEMKPNHGGGVSTNNEGQFEIRLQSLEYDPLNTDTISVKLVSSAQTLFKGFLIQARKYNSLDPIAKGKMNGPVSLTGPVCGSSGNGMTHTDVFSNNWSSEISLSWKPIADVCESIDMGDLRFQATVVRSFGEKAQILIYSPILKMKNVTDPNVIQFCKEKNGSSRITFSLSFGIIMLFVLQF